MVCGAVCGAARESQTSGGVLDLCLPSTDERTTRESDLNSLLFRLVIFFFSPINYSHTRVLLHQTRRAFQTFPGFLTRQFFMQRALASVSFFYNKIVCVYAPGNLHFHAYFTLIILVFYHFVIALKQKYATRNLCMLFRLRLSELFKFLWLRSWLSSRRKPHRAPSLPQEIERVCARDAHPTPPHRRCPSRPLEA